MSLIVATFFFFSSRRRHTRLQGDWSSDVCSSDLVLTGVELSPYVVEGRTPDAAVFPGSVEEVSAVIALVGEFGLPVIPWGGGTAASVGLPSARAGLVLGLRRLNRLVEHEPGDLTVTVEAGTTVGEIGRASCRGRVEI